MKSADASANYATQTNFSALDEKVTGLQNTLDSMSGDSWDKIQETVTKLENLEKNGLLTITTPNAQQPQPEDPVTPNPNSRHLRFRQPMMRAESATVPAMSEATLRRRAIMKPL